MSKATKRKHVTKELLDNYDLPTENQTIVKVLGGRGNNLHEVETPDGDTFLASMPVKFRKNVWMKRGVFRCLQGCIFITNHPQCFFCDIQVAL
jgi:probable RNA-binding protein EIF1AD